MQIRYMEVTSHALDQGRVQHIEYDVAIFTNLTSDHLDYHGTMESYCQAKQRLFQSLTTGNKPYDKWAIVNVDSPSHRKMIEGCPARIMTYGINHKADLHASDIRFDGFATTFMLTYQGKTLPCRSPLIGRFNVYNALAAMGVLLSRGVALEQIITALGSFHAVSGRLEPVPNALGC